MGEEFTFSAQVWLYEGKGAWHFITLPIAVSRQIQELLAGTTKPFGSVKVAAVIGETRWKTSLFPDTKRRAYLLPVKAAVRKREQLQAGMEVAVSVEIDEPQLYR